MVTFADDSVWDWPEYGLVDDVRPRLADLSAPGALATLVAVDGPSPRPPGAQFLVEAGGALTGYVSGGCVEGSLALLAREVVESGARRVFVFGKGSPYLDVQLVCGARIEVLLERVDPTDPTLAALKEAERQRTPILRWIPLETGPAWTEAAAEGPLLRFDADRHAYGRRYDPSLRVAIFGADAVALALARLAEAAGLAVTLVRPQGPPMGPKGLTGAYVTAGATAALAALRPDPWTAIVATSHDLDQDHAVLCAALPSPALYVGALGSRRRLADRVRKLEAAGLDWAAVKRLRAPVGLDIGGQTPFEIALSILADIVRIRRGK